ncbi:alpha/beta hydrolase [Acinetobacter rudis]|uniref:alpha/beta fold hydrolase n=1 Tax=Acinetobacter rudis TaxID=632955 RepID=UPI00280F756E|nr:alpha/beta hydrolase [Acinetobacter rudis]MDQ8953975.1 alpha/beta hydrolase [Acinetobacter rudis]
MQGVHDKNWIFLPGASGRRQFWQPVVEQLDILEQATVLGYPGFDGVLSKPQVNDFESLQCYVLDQIQQPSIVVAQSMGGIFAVQAVLNKPELVQALVLVATSGGIDLTPFHVMDWRESYQQQFDLPDWFVVEKSSVIEEALHQITCPVLLLWGDNDPISPIGVGQYLQQKFQWAELEIIQDGQHDLAFTHARQVGSLIQNFVLRTLL